jgi:hypothetical protein
MKTLRLLLSLGFVLMVGRAGAEELELLPVPAAFPEPRRSELKDERAELLRRWDASLATEEKLKQRYAGAKKGTPLGDEAEARRGELQAEVDAIGTAADTFNETITHLTQALAPTNPVVDPRRFVTASEYDYAKQWRTDLLRRRALIEGQLEKLHAIGDSLRRDSREFEKLREQAQIDCLEDVLMKIPAGACFEGLAARNLINKEQAKVLADGFNTLKLLVETQQAISAKGDEEKFQKVLSTRNELRELLMGSAVEKLDPKARLWLQTLEGVFDAAAQSVGPDDGTPRPHIAETVGKALVAVGEAVFPPAALVEITGTVAEKSLRQHYLKAPLAALDGAMSKNFDARRVYTARLEAVDYQLSAVQDTIGRYEAVH